MSNEHIPYQFPIQNNAACQLKWSWSTIFLNRGTTSSCHRGRHWQFDETTLKDFHNHPGKIGDREKMLKGIWPGNGCEYCRDVEALGGQSDRTANGNTRPGILPPELLLDATATVVTPKLVEVYFSNLCNQSCVYCRPSFSSQIAYELEKYGSSQYNIDYNDTQIEKAGEKYSLYLKLFWKWLSDNHQEVAVFQILGGEPLYQPEFDQFLEFLENHPSPNMAVKVFTNMNHNPVKFNKQILIIERLVRDKKIKEIELVCSIDCWGEDLEYIRYGLDLKICEENIHTVLKSEFINLFFHATISPLSLPSMHLLTSKVFEWGLLSHHNTSIHYNWNTVVKPECFNIYNFGPALMPYVDQTLEVFKKNGGLKPWQQTLSGIKAQLQQSKPDTEQIKRLSGFLDELDVRRKLDWRSQFPQINKLINNYIIT